MNESSQTLQVQGSPILLLAYLQREFPHLPAAAFNISSISPDLLHVSIHRTVRRDFETWRAVLGLPVADVHTWGLDTWLATSGSFADVPVKLLGHGSADDVAAVAELAAAVELLGALPVPTGQWVDPCRPCGCPTRFNRHADGCPDPVPLPGELAEQRHLRDPLDHVLEHLADERPAVTR